MLDPLRPYKSLLCHQNYPQDLLSIGDVHLTLYCDDYNNLLKLQDSLLISMHYSASYIVYALNYLFISSTICEIQWFIVYPTS